MQPNGDPPVLATIVFPRMDSKIMLATKMRGVGVGYLNGWGGGVEQGESIHECVIRKFYEETGGAEIHASALHCHGVVHFRNFREDGTFLDCDVYVYTTRIWLGQIHSTEFMRNPEWHKIYNLEKLNLMPGDKFWLPLFITGRNLQAWVTYIPGQRELIDEVEVSDWPGQADQAGAF
jgi:ADP-ribose pyrophosphatase YjhB (NUDIX family)